ncbi:hypothetical protein EDD85DRAFT_793399 [Armillaria nabsnona]|nr:hypothetical protein EDD85DRAFT_793399 [Armillaria nabsnona]
MDHFYIIFTAAQKSRRDTPTRMHLVTRATKSRTYSYVQETKAVFEGTSPGGSENALRRELRNSRRWKARSPSPSKKGGLECGVNEMLCQPDATPLWANFASALININGVQSMERLCKTTRRLLVVLSSNGWIKNSDLLRHSAKIGRRYRENGKGPWVAHIKADYRVSLGSGIRRRKRHWTVKVLGGFRIVIASVCFLFHGPPFCKLSLKQYEIARFYIVNVCQIQTSTPYMCSEFSSVTCAFSFEHFDN